MLNARFFTFANDENDSNYIERKVLGTSLNIASKRRRWFAYVKNNLLKLQAIIFYTGNDLVRTYTVCNTEIRSVYCKQIFVI